MFWASLVAIAVVMIIRMLSGSSRSSDRQSEGGAEEILKQRYARGELTSEEFDEMLARMRQ
jgi:uncharacterized membrane protein